MYLEIPGFSNYYLNTEDNGIYSRFTNRRKAERVNWGDHDHRVVEIGMTNDEGKRRTMKKHRIVYMAYHPDRDISNLQINHMDENPENNDISNLMACTAKDNINWGTCIERMSAAMRGRPNLALSQPVKATIIETGEVEYYQSISEAKRSLNTQARIGECCKGLIDSAAGRHWEYYYGD